MSDRPASTRLTRDPMVVRFCLYTTLRNFRLFEPFFVLFFVLDLGLDYAAAAYYLGYQQIVWALLEVPGGVITDRWGRRRALIAAFIFAAVAFAMLAASSFGQVKTPVLLAALTAYGLSESLRSGTHKAIMLHWAERRGESQRADEVIALTRLFSKMSAGFAALLGGLLLWLTDSFAMLFLISAAVCLVGAGLIVTYPRELEGEARHTQPARTGGGRPWFKTWSDAAAGFLRSPGLVAILGASVLFESQVKAARLYLQPYLAEGFNRSDIAVMGGLGGVAIGLYFLVQDTFAGYCATLGKHLKKRVRGLTPAMYTVHVAGSAAILLVTAMLWLNWRWAGLPCLLLLVGLQNLRRPLFLAALDMHMDRHQRATTLSIESLARSIAVTLTVIAGGFLADATGLRTTYLLIALLLGLGLIPAWRVVLQHRMGIPGRA